MFDGVSYIERPTLRGVDGTITTFVRHSSIAPNGTAAPFNHQGHVNLYEQATDFFGALRRDNVFTGSNNVFQGNVQVQRCHVPTGGCHRFRWNQKNKNKNEPTTR